MAILPLKQIGLPDAATQVIDRWLGELGEQLADPATDRNAVTRDTLFHLYYPGREDLQELLEDPATPAASRAALQAFDPRNITLEPEYYGEVDHERFGRVKPLLWLWQRFDHSPAGGNNVALGVRLRRLLAGHIFRSCGRNFKCFQFAEVSFGYNLDVGDDVVIHRHVLLDDRGGITLGNRVSIADYANIYSHTHSIDDQKDVSNLRTVLEDDVRITYHATVLAGTRIGKHGMVGACAVATNDVRPYHVNVGIPARSIAIKSIAPPEARSTKRVPHHIEGDDRP